MGFRPLSKNPETTEDIWMVEWQDFITIWQDFIKYILLKINAERGRTF